MPQRQMSMLHLNKAGSKLVVAMEISHVTVTASKINLFSRLRGALEIHVLDPVHLQLGIDAVMLLRLIVAIALCMVNTVEMHVTMTAVATDARRKAEGMGMGMHIVNEAQIASVGAQVLVALAMTCPRLVLNSWNTMQACAKE